MARILLIDDDPMIRATLPLALAVAGHEAVVARDGKEGLRLLRQAPIDLVLTDVLMPEADGLEVLGAVHKEFPGLPVIAISGGSARLPGTDGLQLARYLGAAAVLAKPFTEQELREAVERALGGLSQ
jgi:CheY-like chemotaxis protein